MKMQNGMKRFFEERARYWYIVAAVFVVLGIADYGFLSIVIPLWARNIIMIVLIILATAYIAIMYNYSRQKCKAYMADRQENLFDRINNLQKHIDELEEQLSEVLKRSIDENTAKAITEIRGAIELTDASLKRKVEEAAESQTKELSSNIMSTQSLIKDEARNLADNARSSTEQIATLVSVAGKQTDAAIAEAVERMISDAAKNQKASESRDDANRANQEKAQLQIRNMIEESDKATATLAADIAQTLAGVKTSTVQDTERIVQSISDIGNAIVTKIVEKNEGDEQAYEDVRRQIISSEKNIISNSNEIGEKEASNLKDIQSQIGELEQKVDDSVDNTNNCTIQIVDKIEQSDTEQRKTASAAEGHIISKVDEAFAYVGDRLEGISEAINNGSLACEERIGDAEAKLTSMISSAAASGKADMEAKAEELSNKASVMQNELARLMIQLLDDQEEDAQKAKSASDGIFNQIVRFSNEARRQIESIQGSLDTSVRAIEKIKSAIDASANEQYSQTSLINDKVDTYSKTAGNYQKVIFTRLDRLQDQVANLNSLSDVIRNFAAVQQQAGQAAASEKKEPDRTEEIRDPETGITVFNHYKNNKLISSEMRKGRQKTYEVEYDAQGRIIHSRNFDANGLVSTDLQFYPNGQVKTRTERVTVDGKVMTVTSQFDEQGNKKG